MCGRRSKTSRRPGSREIVLVAQDLAAYGRDLDDSVGIVDLIDELSAVDGLRRMRLYYLYPREIRPALDRCNGRQSARRRLLRPVPPTRRGALLRAMLRPGTGARHLELIASIRNAAPQAALRSSFIVGFPGESDEDVEELGGFLREARLDWAGFFPFSPEEGTAAAGFAAQVPDGETHERLRYLQAIQDDITATQNAAQVGRTLEVVVDQVEDGRPVGRSYREAPEIDGVMLLDRGNPGEWLQARVTGGYGTDLTAMVVGEA